jgi:hypothetical protein
MPKKIYMKAIAGLVELVMPALLKSMPRRSEKNKVTIDYHEMRLNNIEEIQLKQSELNENILLELKRKQRSIRFLYVLLILVIIGLILSFFI